MTAFFCLSAVAQDTTPLADVFLGYSFMRVNSDQQIPAFTAQGGLANVAINITNHIGIEGEFGGWHNGNIGGAQLDTTSYSYAGGPRLSYGRSKRIDPWVHVLFGVNRIATSIAANSVLIPTPQALPIPVGGRYSTSQANFAMPVGGGLDIRVSKHILLRPIQLDYYLTRFETPDFLAPVQGGGGIVTSNKNQNNLRFAAGITFSLGDK